MLCRDVRQILAESFDQPLAGWREQAIAEHLSGCSECRRDEFYFKQVSNLRDLLMPYEVSPNFNYKLQVRMANSGRLPALNVRPGVKRHSWYFSLASAGALAVLALLLAPWIGQKETKNLPVDVATQEPISTSVPRVSSPFPLLVEIAQASERSNFRLKPESPLAARFASAMSEPVRPGIDGEEAEGWQDEFYWVGSSGRGILMPVRRYGQPAASNPSVLLLPASGATSEVGVVY